jgi:hypothetical protein
MENSDNNTPRELPTLALMSICLALLGAIVPILAPLDSSRPVTQNKTVGVVWQGIEDVESRLWQDPFKVASEHPSPELEVQQIPNKNPECGDTLGHHELSALKTCIEARSKSAKVLALGVMVSGGSYTEDEEFRMRARYAVLSGLASSGYFPTDAKHIGFFWGRKVLPILPQRIPFEWLENSDPKKSPSEVLIMWLDETAFAKNPLETTLQLTRLFDAPRDVPDNSVYFHFIGPSGSDTLKAMANELKNENTKAIAKSILAQSSINVAATADSDAPINMQDDNVTLQAIAQELKNNEAKPKTKDITGLALSFINAAATADLNIHSEMKSVMDHLPIRSTLTDTDLAYGILKELKLRGIGLNCRDAPNFLSCMRLAKKPHIALISEWDSFYGREAFPIALKNALKEQCEIYPREDEQDCLASFLEFSYMRGLDGALPEAPKAEVKKPVSGLPNFGERAETFVMEKPEGQSQKDYLRRLGDRIASANQTLIRKGESGFRAIGVVGSDTYDKLMVLKALRPKFPGTIFFTTDLDARLMHPNDFEFTRNLVVASSFGLELDQSLQMKIPPFRDSFQTGYFLATQILLCDPKIFKLRKSVCIDPTKFEGFGDKVKRQQNIHELLSPPRIFELGLSRQPFDLSERCIKSDNHSCQSVHPGPPPSYFTRPLWTILMSILILFGVMGILISSRYHNFWVRIKQNTVVLLSRHIGIKESKFQALTLFLIMVLVIISSSALAYALRNAVKDEPFAWAQGVSMWPTELIRLVAFVLGCIFLCKATRRLNKSKTELGLQFFQTGLDNPEQKFKFLDVLLAPWKWNNEENLDKVTGRLNPKKLWAWYCQGTSTRRQWTWIAAATALFFLLGMLLVQVFGMPNVPYRGRGMLLLDEFILYPCVFVFICLVMLTYHTTQFSAQLITQLGNHPSNWPEETLQNYALLAMKGNPIRTLRDKLIEQKCYFLDELIDIHFISEHTKLTGNIVYYPFVILTLMIFARSRIFDDWHIPTALVLIYLLIGVLSLVSILCLRRAVKEAKENVLNQLNTMLRMLALHSEPSARILETQTQRAIKEILANRQGAFIPLAQEPAVQAILLPLGGWGGQALLQYFVLMGA